MEARRPSDDKKRKLDELERFRRKLPHMSMSALAAVCKVVKESGVPSLSSRTDQRMARDELRAVTTPYGNVIRPLTLSTNDERKPLITLVANLWALLYHLFNVGGGFADLLMKRLRSNPSSPRCPWTT